jgi:predicted dehydrogenase
MTIPQLEVWTHPGQQGWLEPLARMRVPVAPEDPLVLQIRHFCDVIRNGAAPLASGRAGLQALKVVAAVKQSARSGQLVEID